MYYVISSAYHSTYSYTVANGRKREGCKREFPLTTEMAGDEVNGAANAGGEVELQEHSSLAELEEVLTNRGLTHVPEFIALLRQCNLISVAMVRRFPNLAKLASQLFDTSTEMGKLQASGFHVAVSVSHPLFHPTCYVIATSICISARRCVRPYTSLTVNYRSA